MYISLQPVSYTHLEYADTERFTYCRTDRNHVYHDAGASIRDNNTTFINRHSMHEDVCHGLALEIMPIDGCAPGKISRALQLVWAMTFALFNAVRITTGVTGNGEYIITSSV